MWVASTAEAAARLVLRLVASHSLTRWQPEWVVLLAADGPVLPLGGCWRLLDHAGEAAWLCDCRWLLASGVFVPVARFFVKFYFFYPAIYPKIDFQWCGCRVGEACKGAGHNSGRGS